MRRGNFCVWPASLMLLAWVLLASAPATAVAPAGKSFAVVLLMFDTETGELEVERGCARFAATSMCTEDEDCGPWEFTQRLGVRNEWRAWLELEADGELIEGTIFGLTERRGPGNAIAGTLLLSLADIRMNASFAGVQTRRARCLDWAASDE